MFRIGITKHVMYIPSWKEALTKLRQSGVELTEAVQAMKLVKLGSTCWVSSGDKRIEVSEG